MTPITTESAIDGLASRSASLSTNKKLVLTPDSSYVFGGMFFSQLGAVTPMVANCHMMVTIVR